MALDYLALAAAMRAADTDAELAAVLEDLVPPNSIAGLTAEVIDLIARIDGTIIADGPPADDVGYIGAVYIDKINFNLYGPKTLDGWGDPVPTVGLDGQNARHSVAVFAEYGLGPSERFAAYEAVDAVTYSPTLSRAHAGTVATASTVITIRKNGSAWGTVTFAAGVAAGTFSIGSPSQAAGDVLTFHGPASPDATLADINITLAGA